MISSKDPLELNEVLLELGIELDYKQLSKGDFCGEITVNEDDDVVFFHEIQSTNVDISGTVDENTYFFLFDDYLEEGIQLNHSIAKSDELYLFRPGSEFRGITSKPAAASQVLVSKDLFNQKITSRLQDEFWNIEDMSCLTISQQSHTLFRNEIKNIIQHGGDFNHALIDCLAEIIIDSRALPEKSVIPQVGRPQKQNSEIFYKCQDFIQWNLTQGISIEAICNHIGISQRHLDRIFNAHVGMSIKKYITCCKINAIRLDLIKQDARSTTVHQIVMNYDIFHLGRFANFYNQFFGEYPLETLKR